MEGEREIQRQRDRDRWREGGRDTHTQRGEGRDEDAITVYFGIAPGLWKGKTSYIIVISNFHNMHGQSKQSVTAN